MGIDYNKIDMSQVLTLFKKVKRIKEIVKTIVMLVKNLNHKKVRVR